MKAVLTKKTNISMQLSEVADKLGLSGHARIRRLVKKFKKTTETTEGLVAFIISDLFVHIYEKHDDVKSVSRDVLCYVKKKCRKHPERCRLLLLELLDILASYSVQDRQLVRDVLNILFNYYKIIDREVLLFKYSKCRHFNVPHDDPDLEAKQNYILSMVAGWKVPWVQPTCKDLPIQYYLEQRFRCEDFVSASHIMAEALFRLQDPDLVLRLLQHGVYPSAVFLWPISIVSEMLCKVGRPVGPTSYEVTVMRYFCRARNHFLLAVLPFSDMVKQRRDQLVKRFLQQPEPSEDILLVSDHTKKLYPAERYSVAAELKQQCRTAIRRCLLQTDCLPRGISHLGLPRLLQDYLSLLLD